MPQNNKISDNNKMTINLTKKKKDQKIWTRHKSRYSNVPTDMERCSTLLVIRGKPAVPSTQEAEEAG
jgi:hypothetical protein